MKSGVAQNQATQSQLIRQACDEANQEAFELLLQSHRPRLVRVVMRWTDNVHDAEDMTQLALSKAHLAIDRFATDLPEQATCSPNSDPDQSLEKRFAGWLDRIAFRCTLDLKRKRKKLKTVQLDSIEAGCALADLTEAHEAAYRESHRLFSFAKTHLNSNQYAALYFCYVDGLTTAEIAAELRSSSIAIRALLFRARRALKSAIRKHGFDHE